MKNSMTLNEYQDGAMSFRLPSATSMYAMLNLAGEVGEVLSLEAKMIRDGGSVDAYRLALAKELGDVLWHIAAIADDNGLSLDGIARVNIDKLASRKARNQLKGSGDDR